MTFYFILDQTYKKGTYEMVKQTLKEGKPISQFLNDKPTSIYIATSFNGKYMKVNSRIKILAKHFDSENHKVRKSHPDYAQINLLLHDYKHRLEIELRDKLIKRIVLTPAKIKEMMLSTIKGESTKTNRITFFSAFDEFIEEKKNSCKPITIVKYRTCYNLLKDFEKETKPICFEDIDMQFETQLRDYSAINKSHLNNTIAKNFRTIKTFLNWCYGKEYTNKTNYLKFNGKGDEVEVVYLTNQELKKLEELELKPFSRLDKTRDLFLYQLYTGQRYGDVQNLKYKDVEKINDIVFWNNFQLKGKKPKMVRIPLSTKAVHIIEKHTNIHKNPEDRILPSASNVKTNLYIKEVCKLAGIDEMFTQIHFSGRQRIESVKPKYEFISTHVARKTFITLSLEKGMPKETIMKISGHEDERTMRPYIKISEQFYTKEFNKAWE